MFVQNVASSSCGTCGASRSKPASCVVGGALFGLRSVVSDYIPLEQALILPVLQAAAPPTWERVRPISDEFRPQGAAHCPHELPNTSGRVTIG